MDLSRAVATLSPLRVVHLINVPVTDEGLKELSKLPHLESLYLDGPRVTEAGWEWLFENHPELHVHINQRHHDRDPRHHYHTSEDPNESPDKPEIDWIPGKGPAEAVRAAEKAEAEAAGETASSSGGNDP